MEPVKADSPKLPDMVMCGDHPSFTKTELNLKETVKDEKHRLSVPASLPKLNASLSRTERILSDHMMTRRTTNAERAANVGNSTLVQATLGSFRWPPYLLCVWVLVLVLTHALYCLLTVLEKALPTLKRVCGYLRGCTEESWLCCVEPRACVRVCACACLCVVAHALYALARVTRALAAWLLDPLCATDSYDACLTSYLHVDASRLAFDVPAH